MNKLMGFLLLCLMFFIYISLGGCDDRTEDAKMVHQAIHTTAKTLNHRYQVYYMGFSEAGDETHYKKIGVFFELFRVVVKDEARQLLINCAEEFLKELNSNPNLQPYLEPSPLTVANIDLIIYVRHPDGQLVYHPDLGILSLRQGLIRYSTDIPEMQNKFGFYTEEKESYEEALKIVQAQALPSNPD